MLGGCARWEDLSSHDGGMCGVNGRDGESLAEGELKMLWEKLCRPCGVKDDIVWLDLYICTAVMQGREPYFQRWTTVSATNQGATD